MHLVGTFLGCQGPTRLIISSGKIDAEQIWGRDMATEILVNIAPRNRLSPDHYRYHYHNQDVYTQLIFEIDNWLIKYIFSDRANTEFPVAVTEPMLAYC